MGKSSWLWFNECTVCIKNHQIYPSIYTEYKLETFEHNSSNLLEVLILVFLYFNLNTSKILFINVLLLNGRSASVPHCVVLWIQSKLGGKLQLW